MKKSKFFKVILIIGLLTFIFISLKTTLSQIETSKKKARNLTYENRKATGEVNITYTTIEKAKSLEPLNAKNAATDSIVIRIFYPKYGTQNPSFVKVPNWYYYWKNGNVVPDLSQFEYANADYYGFFDEATGKLYVGNEAPRQSFLLKTVVNKYTGDSYIIGSSGKGIYCCAETTIHELTHKWLFENLHGKDSDEDGLPDEFEINSPYHFNPNDRDTYNLQKIDPEYLEYGDSEFLARLAERTPHAVNPSGDWSEGGENW